MSYLTHEQIAFYENNGYLLIEDFWTNELIETLKLRMNVLVNSADLSQIKSVFSTTEQNRKSDSYFLNSGRDIRYFWEEKAPWNEDHSALLIEPSLCINKVGHGLHDLDPLFERVSYDTRIGRITRELGLEKPLLVQSMYIFKQPNIGGDVCPHQDGAFLYTEPQSCIGFWWPLHDCTQANGCLWAVPGSHNLPVTRRYRRKDPPNEGTEFFPPEPVSWDLTGAVPLEIKKGTLVILHHALVHYSEENLSDHPRHAYSIHVVDGKEGFVYPKDNWLQRPEGFPFNEIPLA